MYTHHLIIVYSSHILHSCFYFIIILGFCHERQLQSLERKAKVEGSQLRVYKTKEGSRRHEAIACLNILGSPT
jgi:hypothetical protein